MDIEVKKSSFGESEPLDMDKLLQEGWKYVSTPFVMSIEVWDMTLDFIGKGNYRLLAVTEIANEGGDELRRGQYLVSPAGLDRMLEFARTGKITGVDMDKYKHILTEKNDGNSQTSH